MNQSTAIASFNSDVQMTPPCEDWPLLHSASANGQIEVVNALLAGGTEVDAATQQGFTCLHCASQNGREKVVKRLLAAGANVNATTSQGMTSTGHRTLVMNKWSRFY